VTLVESGRIPRGARVWAPQAWGSFIEWAAPDVRLGIDSRIELFPPPVLADADEIAGATTGWLSTLAVRRVDALVIATGAGSERQLTDLEASRAWQQAYTDDDGSIWLPARVISGPVLPPARICDG